MAKILKAETIETDLLGSNGNNAISLQRNSSSLLTLNTSDNVGIGTTVPTSKFEVKGSSNPGIALSSTDVNIDTGGVFRINLTNASSTLFEAGLISVKHSSSNQTLNAESSYISFSTRSAGTIGERLRIDSSGNVGIGTGSPSSLLHVAGSVGSGIKVYSLTVPSANSETSRIAFGDVVNNLNVAVLRGIYESGSAGAGTYSGGIAFNTTFNSTGQERLRIDSSGNVGIGTTSPGAPLTVQSDSVYNSEVGAIRLQTATDTNKRMFLGYDKNLNAGYIQSQQAGTNWMPTLINPNGGNVGIGTTSPEGKLDAYGTGYFGFQNFSTQAVQKVLVLRGEPVSGVYAQSRFNFYTTPGTTVNGIAKIDIKSQYSTESESSSLLTLTGSGNVGIGTTNPITKLQVTVPTQNYVSFGNISYGAADWYGLHVGYTEANNSLYRKTMIAYEGLADNSARGNLHLLVNTVFSSASATIADSKLMISGITGNVGIGTTSPGSPLVVSRNANDTLTRIIIDNPNAGSSATTILGLSNNGGTVAGLKLGSSAFSGLGGANVLDVFNNVSHTILSTLGIERLRITSGGYLKASDTGTYVNSAVTYHELRNSASEVALLASNSNAIPQGIQIRFTSAPNDATSQFLNCNDGNGITNRAIIRSNGGVLNYQANDGNFSDERLKTDIQPSPSYLDKICSIPVVNFKYKDQTHDDYNLGAIAQQVESVCPELVDADGFGETPEDGIPIKAIYQTDLQYALMKCIQELKSENNSLKSRIEALEAK